MTVLTCLFAIYLILWVSRETAAILRRRHTSQVDDDVRRDVRNRLTSARRRWECDPTNRHANEYIEVLEEAAGPIAWPDPSHPRRG